jgi:hypothetical protein
VYKVMNLRDIKKAPSSSSSYATVSFSRRILFHEDLILKEVISNAITMGWLCSSEGEQGNMRTCTVLIRAEQNMNKNHVLHNCAMFTEYITWFRRKFCPFSKACKCIENYSLPQFYVPM